MEIAPRLLTESRNMFDAMPQVGADGLELFGRGDELLKSTRHGADASLDPGRNELGEQVEEQFGVFEPALSAPVRQVNLFFDAAGVELAVGEAVNGEDVAMLGSKPALKFEERRPF